MIQNQQSLTDKMGKARKRISNSKGIKQEKQEETGKNNGKYGGNTRNKKELNNRNKRRKAK